MPPHGYAVRKRRRTYGLLGLDVLHDGLRVVELPDGGFVAPVLETHAQPRENLVTHRVGQLQQRSSIEL
jgi:hypothetical protein